MVEKTRAEQEDHEDPMLVDVDEPHQDHNDDIEVLDPNCERLLLERSRFAECGVISKIKLINFMCHENLEVNLSPHVNFIHGENGSGKSAILVAISTCLGVKASDTNRGSSLKELIKQGQEWGQVELTLTNKGSDAFDRQKYGNHITIRREITKTISTYKIMNDKGAIVGRTKKDLQGILDHFNIQVENPCVVMNQDTTKEFLLSNKNSSKYDFFLKATQLEQMGNIIDATTKDYDHANRYLGDAQKQLDILEKHFKEKEHLYNCTRDLAIIDQQIDELNDECLWAKVQEVGHDVDIKRSTTSEYTEKLQELHNQLSKLQIEKDAANKAYEDAKKALEAERHVINDDIRKRQDLGNSLQMAKKTVARFQAQLAQYEKNEQTAIKRCNDLQEQMRQLEAQRTRDRYQEDQERAEQIHKLKLRLVEQSEQVREAQIEAERCRHELDKCREAVKQNQNFLSDRRSYKRELDGELQSLERAASNHLNRFGRDMSALVHKIQLESRMFSTSPIGPIGAYVSMKDKRYSNAVQLAIGKKILCGFVVDSWADQKVLVKIFQNFYRNPWDIPKIIVLKKAASKYDIVPKNPLYGDYSRVVDVVDVSDPWCFNALVDMSQIDCSLLVPDASSAQLLLRKMEQRRERTPVVFTQHLERITLNKGSLNNSHLGGNRLNSILDSVTEADLDNRKRLAADVQAQINSIEAEGFELKRVVDRASDSSRLAAKKVQSQSSDLETTKADIANLEKQAAFDDDQVGSLIFSLHDKIAKCNQLIDDAKNDQLVCSENLVHAREDYELKLRDVEVFNENASKAGSSLEQATEQVNIAMKHVAEVQVKIEKIIPLQHTMERKVQGMMQEIDSVVEKLESIRQEALAQTSGRVLQSDRSSADILKEIYKLEEKKQADREAISSDSLEEITAAYIKAKEDFEAACLRVAESERDCIRIEKKLKSSSKDWDIFKKRLSKQASYDFQYNMSQKGHQGHIKFDHERGTLHMFVKMQHHQGENEMTSDTKALSGGERSFTTLAFVIAIGESIRTPFRALDEFDIFMDSVNRKIAINLLLELAKKYQNRQFIFITPQDVSMITTSPTTFVLMLKPPVRPAN